MSKKVLKRIYQKDDGKWALETTRTTGQVYTTTFDCREHAEQLVALSEKYDRKYVSCKHKDGIAIGRVSNTGLLYKRNGLIDEMLYVTIKGSTYLKRAADCELYKKET